MSQNRGEKCVYVVMPVSATETCSENEWKDIFNEVFTPAFRDCGYTTQRATPSTGNLIKSIITELRSSWLVLADLTDRNANVFYELGVRHSLSKRTILVAQESSHIPSDLLGYWWLVYGTKPGEVATFRKEISKLVRMIEEDPDRSDSPVSDYLEHEAFGVSSFVAHENMKKLSALFTEMSATVNTLQKIQDDPRYASFLHSECLDLLLTTLYVDVGIELLRQCYELRHTLRVLQSGLSLDRIFIEEASLLASTILHRVHELRKLLAGGEFVEPNEVSVMVWSAIRLTNAALKAEEKPDWRYSRAEDMSKIDLDGLKKDLDDLQQ